MYKIIANLEGQFNSLEEAKSFATKFVVDMPKMPRNWEDLGESVSPHISVFPTLEDCITFLGIDNFARCCDTVFNNDREVFPVLVLDFGDRDDYVKPSCAGSDEVGEMWLTVPAKPKSASLHWISSSGIEVNDRFGSDEYPVFCKRVWFSDPFGMDHPWLNGKGHKLNSPIINKTQPSDPEEHIRRLADSMSLPDLHLIRLMKNNPNEGFRLADLALLAQRSEEYFYNNDDPRFTPEDLADALLSMNFAPYLEKVLKADDEQFDALAAAAAEEYRYNMSLDMQESEKSFLDLIQEL